eukprot:jgi/Bigna1/75875/fgenesh1_pg.37_\
MLRFSACRSGRHWEKALSYINTMRSSGTTSEPVTATTIACLSDCGEWRRALRLVNPDELLIESAARPFQSSDNGARAGKAEECSDGALALEMRTISRQSGAQRQGPQDQPQQQRPVCHRPALSNARSPPSVLSFNVALHACEKGVQWETSLALLASMRALELRADSATYQSAVNALCSEGKYSRGMNITMSAMEKGDLRPDGILYEKGSKSTSGVFFGWTALSTLIAALLSVRDSEDQQQRRRAFALAAVPAAYAEWGGSDGGERKRGCKVERGDDARLGGIMKQYWSDFIVREIPKGEVSPLQFQGNYAKSDGNKGGANKNTRAFWALSVGKVRMTTYEAVEELARKFGISQEKVQFAGMKDFQGCTLQRMTLPNPHHHHRHHRRGNSNGKNADGGALIERRAAQT